MTVPPEEPGRSTRRQFVAGSLGALASVPLLLAACGGDDEEAAPPAEPDSSATTGAGTTAAAETTAAEPAFPVTIEHKYGSTEITELAERVITVGYNDQDAVLALGITPIAVRGWYAVYPNEVWPWMEPHVSTPPEVLEGDFNFEQIATMQPDLILAVYDAIEDTAYDRFSQIAPTVAHHAEFPDYGTPREERTLTIARALGQEARGQELLDAVEERFAAAREQYPQFEGKTAVIAIPGEPGQYWGYGPPDPRMRFLTDLGFVLPEEYAAVAADQYSFPVSKEQFSLLEADILVWVPLTPDRAEMDAITGDAIYQTLEVVQGGRDLVLGFDAGGALSYDGVLSLPWAMDEILPQLAELVLA